MSGTLILLYHRVAEPALDPFKLAVAPDNFARQVEHLADLRCVVPLGEVRSGARAPRIAVTFDDGYADNAEVAAPLLADAGLPATWFITAGRLGRQQFWWDRLADALVGGHPLPDSVDVDLPGSGVWLDLRTAAARARALTLVHHRIRPLPTTEVEAVVDSVISAVGAPPPPPDALTMSDTQLREMARLPGAEIGAHTLTHIHLGGQSTALKRREISGSVERLSALLGRPVRTFAYPYGDTPAVDREAQRLVRDAGCDLACSTTPGIAHPRRNRFTLPRVVVGNWTVEEFRSVLARAAAT